MINTHSPKKLAFHWLMAALIFGVSSVGTLPQVANSQELTSSLLLRPHIENLNAKHDQVTQAIEIFKTGDFAKAKELLDSVCEADTSLPPAELLLATMFQAANRPNLARTELENAMRNRPTDPGAILIFAESAIQNGRYAEAEILFERASQLTNRISNNDYRKQNIQNRIALNSAAIAEYRNSWGEAADLLKPVAAKDPDNSNVISRLARSLFKSGQSDESLTLLQKHWNENKKTTQRPEITMAVLYQEANNLKKAEELMIAASELEPENAVNQTTVARWALENGKLDLAKKCVDRASQTQPNLDTQLLSALVARYQEDYETAKSILESAHLESPANLGIILELAMTLSNIKGEENRGLQYAQLAVKIQPDLRQPAGRNAAMSLAWLLYRFGGQEESEKILQNVLRAGQISSECSYFAARILMNKNRSASKQLFEEIIKSGRQFPGFNEAKDLYEKTIW
ncbi:MAG: tetratricopeptide repeat protein [Mariniblastus sp.]